MKQIVNRFPTPTNLVKLDDVAFRDRKVAIGVRGPCDARGFVTRARYTVGNYMVLALDNLKEGNRWTHFPATESLRYLIECILNDSSFEVYLFESDKELMQWLAE